MIVKRSSRFWSLMRFCSSASYWGVLPSERKLSQWMEYCCSVSGMLFSITTIICSEGHCGAIWSALWYCFWSPTNSTFTSAWFIT